MTGSSQSRVGTPGLWAEGLRVLVLVAAVAAMTYPFFTRRFVGGRDAEWYAYMLKDFVDQLRAGHFPVFLGQGTYAWNGAVHPFRSAPIYMWLAGLWDVLTFHRLDVLVLQHLTVITMALAGALGFYAAGVALAPARRWEVMLLALLYVSAPAWLEIIYLADAYMTFMALGVLPLVIYGNARSLLGNDGRGYGCLAAGLALVWMCHPPVAMLMTFGTLILQGGAFLFAAGSPARRRGVIRGALLFAGFSAYYFASMSGLPPRSGPRPWGDALQLGGLGLVVTALTRGLLQRRSRTWLALLLPAGALLWFSGVPWLCWMAITVGLVALVAVLLRRGFGIDPAQRACEILVPCLLLAAGLAQAVLGPLRPERDVPSLLAVAGNAAQAPLLLLPPWSPGYHSYQPGTGLWIIFLLLGLAFFRTRSLALKLSFVVVLLPCFGLIHVPWIGDFLVSYIPVMLGSLVNFPLVLRLLPAMSTFLALGGLVWLAAERGTSRIGRLLFLAAAVALAGVAAAGYVAAALPGMFNLQDSRNFLRPENVVMVHFDYDLLPTPSTFSEGVFDPRLEFRLLDARKVARTSPDDTARRMEAGGATRLRLIAAEDPTAARWLNLSPGLTLAPGEHVLLRFEFSPATNYTGWLIFRSENGYREYYLPNAGLSDGFGTGPTRSHVISLWNSGPTPEHYRFFSTPQAGNDVDPHGGFFATVVVSPYVDARNPVRLESLDPLRVTVDMDQPGWIETTRVFLDGYAAKVDGQPAPLARSPRGLAMVPLSAGRHTVELRYRGTRRMGLAALVSGCAWIGGLVFAWRRRRSGGAFVPPAPAEATVVDGRAVLRFKRWLTVGAFLAVVAGVVRFDLWTVATSGASFASEPASHEYYNRLVAGFREGHLYMDQPLDPALLALPEGKRPGNAPVVMDASLYHGHYYLYFGVTPAVVLLWPYLAVTGHYLSGAAATLIFSLAGFGFAVAWWIEVRRRCFPALGGKWIVAGTAALGLCSLVPSTLRHPLFYEVAACSGYAFAMLALWALARARYRPRSRRGWLALAGVAAGLAVGSRANLAPSAVLLLLLGCASAAWTAADAVARRRAFLAALLPGFLGLGAIGAGLAGYNYARFGHPLDFGYAHQVPNVPQRMFHGANLLHNLRIYYFTPPALNGYFPYVAPGAVPAPPVDYTGREHAHGEWVWLPLVILAIAGAAWAWRRRPRPPADWGWDLAPPLLFFGVNLLVVGAIGLRANRYMLDFQPALLLVTLLALAPLLGGRGTWPAIGRFLAMAGLLLAMAFNVLASIQVQGFFSENLPAEYTRLSHAVDERVWPWLRGEAAAVGDREVTVHWPAPGPGLDPAWEPLLATGSPNFDDVLWVWYDGAGRAQLIYQHGDLGTYGVAYGSWFPLPASGVSRVRISGAFLLPGVGHPWYGDRPAEEQAALKRTVRVTVDGQVRLARDVPSYDSSPRLQQWGWWRPAGPGAVSRFSGRLETPENLPLDDHAVNAAAAQKGDVRFRLRLPLGYSGSVEPLLQWGPATAFDTLAVKYVDAHTVQLIHDSVGAGSRMSDPIPVDYGQTQSVDVELPFATDGLEWTATGGPWPSLVPPSRLHVLWNGREAFTSPLPLPPASAATLGLGGGPRRSSAARLMYSGLLEASPRRERLGPLHPGELDFQPPSAETFEDARGLLLRLERSDGEIVSLVWRHSDVGLQLGWCDGDGTAWSPPLPPGGAAAPIRVLFSAPKASLGVTSSIAEAVRFETIDVSRGGQAVLSGSTDIFSSGRVEGQAILPAGWSGSARMAEEIRAALPVLAPVLPGRINLRFRLPRPGSESGPLLSAGITGAADSIYLRPTPDGKYVLGWDHWGVGATETPPLALATDEAHTLVIELGSLFAGQAISPGLVRLVLDRRVVLSAQGKLYPVRPGQVVVGRNPLGMSTSAAEFRGEILSVRTLQPEPLIVP